MITIFEGLPVRGWISVSNLVQLMSENPFRIYEKLIRTNNLCVDHESLWNDHIFSIYCSEKSSKHYISRQTTFRQSKLLTLFALQSEIVVVVLLLTFVAAAVVATFSWSESRLNNFWSSWSLFSFSSWKSFRTKQCLYILSSQKSWPISEAVKSYTEVFNFKKHFST